MELTNENYHSVEARKEYMGSSQFKDFLKCEKKALARVNGEIKDEKTPALLMGSYIDAYFSGELEQFKKDNPEIFNSKTGTLKADYQKCDAIIKFIEEDEKLMSALSGEHQKIMTGTIAGVPFKIKIDSYIPDRFIVDQKIVKDFKPIWDDKEHCKKNFVDYWGYTIQGAIYREIVKQNTGKTLPFILAVTTKEDTPRKALLKIDSEDLDEALAEVIRLAPRFQKIKNGEIEPEECGICDYCLARKKVSKIESYHVFDPYQENEEEE